MFISEKIRNFTYVFLLISLVVFSASATHIKAGEFNAQRDPNDPLTYVFTLSLYLNVGTGVADQPSVDMVFSDGTMVNVGGTPAVSIGNNTNKRTYTTTHTFNAPGFYKVSIDHSWRNDRIINIPNSGATDFYIELGLLIDPLVGLNQTPILTIPPIDIGGINKIYKHNPGAYDPDGDSISYKLVTPLSGVNQPIPNYSLPNNAAFGGVSTGGGPATLTLNEETGDLIWNTPSAYGSPERYYNVAIMVEEWRYGIRIGYLIRDMQIEIVPTLNDPPIVVIPKDTCVEAGKVLLATFLGSDPNGDPIEMDAYGGPFNVNSNPATETIHSTSIDFAWNTDCSHIRIQPYDVYVQATDINNVPRLVDYKTWRIYVKAPAVKNVQSVPVANAIQLTWDLYSCQNASKISIYRQICSDTPIPSDPCTTGAPDGYVKIGEVTPSVITFTDNNNGVGIPIGVTYCYILVAEFPLPAGGESYPSQKTCAALAITAPVLSVVDVLQTDASNGSVKLAWYHPNSPSLTPPYTYSVQQSVGFNTSTFTTIATGVVDTFYTISGINTLTSEYTYRVVLENNNQNSTFVPTTQLQLKSVSGAIQISWQNNAPWGIDSSQVFISVNKAPYFKTTTIVGIASSYTYNSATGYCDTLDVYVKSFGKYCDSYLSDTNYQVSAIRKIVPLDDRQPPAPVAFINGCSQNVDNTTNVIYWTRVAYANCNTITGYRLYFSPQEGEAYTLLSDQTDTFYIHQNSFSTAGCYKVLAYNRDNVEGAYSNEVCVDDCFYYELPNLVTVNNDGKNDLFEPFPIPFGVTSATCAIYNIWGELIYFSENPLEIKWDGKTKNGPVSDGIYYYAVTVTYNRRLKKSDQVKIFKGWVHIIHQSGVPTK
ncbi:MAG: gliding motility-associated C-terminal domain-containing protein [Cytophagaceae bacterium]